MLNAKLFWFHNKILTAFTEGVPILSYGEGWNYMVSCFLFFLFCYIYHFRKA